MSGAEIVLVTGLLIVGALGLLACRRMVRAEAKVRLLHETLTNQEGRIANLALALAAARANLDSSESIRRGIAHGGYFQGVMSMRLHGYPVAPGNGG